MSLATIHGHPLPGFALSDDLHAIDAEFPGFHAWVSSAGRIIAVHCYTRAETDALEHGLPSSMHAGSGVTLDAPTPALIRYEIACWLARAGRAA